MKRSAERQLNVPGNGGVGPEEEESDEDHQDLYSPCSAPLWTGLHLSAASAAGWWYRKTLALLSAQRPAILSAGQMMNRSLQTDGQTVKQAGAGSSAAPPCGAADGLKEQIIVTVFTNTDSETRLHPTDGGAGVGCRSRSDSEGAGHATPLVALISLHDFCGFNLILKTSLITGYSWNVGIEKWNFPFPESDLCNLSLPPPSSHLVALLSALENRLYPAAEGLWSREDTASLSSWFPLAPPSTRLRAW